MKLFSNWVWHWYWNPDKIEMRGWGSVIMALVLTCLMITLFRHGAGHWPWQKDTKENLERRRRNGIS